MAIVESIDETPPPEAPAETLWRLALRLIVDAFGVAALTAAIMVLLFALIVLGDFALRGLDQLVADAATARGFPAGFSRDDLTLFGFALGSLLYASIVLAFFALARVRRRDRWRDYIAWTPFRPLRIYWLLAAAGVIWGAGAGSLIEALEPAAKDWVVLPKGPAGIAVSFTLVVVLGPLCEELLFRGWLFTALRPWLGRIATILATAVIFAIAHWEKTHLYALAVFPVGLLLGYARERGGGIKPTVAFHGIYNLAGWILAMIAGK